LEAITMRRSIFFTKTAAAVAIAPLLTLAAGCEHNNGDFLDFSGLSGSDRSTFRCDDDRWFQVNYNDDGNEAVVDAGDTSYRLDLRDKDGSRRLYEGDRAELTVSGDEARLQVSGDDDYTDCEHT
jgi:hypothetical protein